MTDRQRREKAAEILNTLLSSAPSAQTAGRNRIIPEGISSDDASRGYAAAYSALGKYSYETAKAAAALSGGYSNGYARAAADLTYGEYLKKAYKAYPELNDAHLSALSADKDFRSRLAEAYDELERSYSERYADEQAQYISALKSWAKIAKYLG